MSASNAAAGHAAGQDAGRVADDLMSLRRRITVLEHALEDAHRFAHCDALTGIPNRRLLEERFKQAEARCDRRRRSLAVLFVDIDGFKQLNDTYGHVIGDVLLRRVAARLVDSIRTSDTACRYGGDEFVILLSELDGLSGAFSATRKIRERLREAYFVGVSPITLTASVGMAVYPADGMQLGGLIRVADSAMYAEKTGKRDWLGDSRRYPGRAPASGRIDAPAPAECGSGTDIILGNRQ